MERLEELFAEAHNYKSIIEVGKLWTDPKFPHDNSVTKGLKGTFRWFRASQILNNKGKLYESFSGNDIEIGVLEDYYLLSSISALAEYPGRIERVFVQKEPNNAGCYLVSLYISGKLVEVAIDDFFPVNAENRLVFTGTKYNELWVMLIEKAWAKVNGRFETIQKGSSCEALAALTGAPVEYLNHKELTISDLWNKLKQFNMEKYVICCYSETKTKGILKGCIYTLIGVYEFPYKGKAAYLLQIRNPWGFSEWTGKWSDNDSNWTSDLRKELNHTSKDDGIFFMPYEDFFKIFTQTFIAKVHDDYSHSDLFIKQPKAIAGFQVSKDLKGFLSCHQITPRLGKVLLDGEYEISQLKLELYKVEEAGTKLFSSRYNNALGQANLDIDLEPGYYVLVGSMNSISKIPALIFTAYTNVYVDLIDMNINDLNEVSLDKLKSAVTYLALAYNPYSKYLKNPKGYEGAFRNCLNGHILRLSKTSFDEGGKYTCECCRIIKKAGEGRWQCKQCSYEICLTCRPTKHGRVVQVKKVNEVINSVKCLNDHEMNYNPLNEKTEIYLCSECGKAYFGEVGRWKCDDCNINLCGDCIPPPPTARSGKKRKEIDTCPKNHALEFLATETSTGLFDCYLCSKLGDTHNGRWACLTCSINICHICKPSSKARDGTISVKTRSLICDSGHILVFGNPPPALGCYLNCTKCEKPIQADNWRWTCRKCEFDVCIDCRPEQEGRKEVVCTNLHKLKYSVLTQGKSIYGRCDRCHNPFKFSNGRYCCLQCGYDCCNKCVSIFGTYKSVIGGSLTELFQDPSTDRNCGCNLI